MDREETPVSCWRNSNIRQFLSLSGGLIGQFNGGVCFAWTSVALVKLLDTDNSPIPITDDSAISNIATMFVVGIILGPIIYSLFIDILGRKYLTLIGLILYILQWIILYFSSQIFHIYIARIVLGFAYTFVSSVLPTYTGEITNARSRSIFGIFIALQVPLGAIYMYSLGPYVGYYTLSLINMIMPLIALLFWLLMVESPYYLVRQGSLDDAKKNLMWLRGETDESKVETEMKAIQEFIAQSPKRPFKEIIKEVGLPSNRKALALVTLLIAGSQFNGATVIRAYFHLIISETGTKLDVTLSIIILESIAFVVLLASFFLINRFGRKFLFLLTCGGCIAGSLVAGLYFMLVSENIIGHEASLMAILGILCMQVFNAFGGASVPAIAVSEMSTASLRSLFGAYFIAVSGSMSAANMKIFEEIRIHYGTQYSFWFYTVSVAIIGVILIFIMPETRGKTLQEIQDILSGDKKEAKKNAA